MRNRSSTQSSPMKFNGSHDDSIWSHYRCAVSRIGKELFTDTNSDHPSIIEDSENSLHFLGYSIPTTKNTMSVVTRRKEFSSLRQLNSNQAVDHNRNQYRDTRTRTRKSSTELTKQLSLDLEEARQQNSILRKLLAERSETITQLKGENNVLQRQIRKLSSGRHSERSKWSSPSRNENDRLHREPSVQSISLSELSPVISRKEDKRRLTYSSETPESSSASTPKRTTNERINGHWLPQIPVSRPSDREEVLNESPIPSFVPPSTSTLTPNNGNEVSQSTPKNIFIPASRKTPSYYLKIHKPEFIIQCEKRQTMIKAAALTRNKLAEERRTIARAVVEGRASFEAAKPFLRNDQTEIKAFQDSEIRSATKKRFRSTSEFQARRRERNDEIERATNKLIAHCFSVNTLQRGRSFAN